MSKSDYLHCTDLRGTAPRLPYEQEALRRVLVWKGLVSNEEVVEEGKAGRRELEATRA